MSILKNIPESLHAPLKSFIEELKGHIDFFDQIALDEFSTPEEKELVRRKIEGRFHLIRGASGFFKLDSLRALSTKGEEAFRLAKGDEEKFDELFNGFFREAVKEIENQFSTLKNEISHS
jgi:hypothetical protein